MRLDSIAFHYSEFPGAARSPIAYAVKHPERVSKLVLYGAFPVGLNHYGSPKNSRPGVR